MKNKVLFIVILVFLSSLIFSARITITVPTTGSHLYQNSSVNIRWNGSECGIQDFKINIFRNSIAQGNFVEQLTVTDQNWVKWTITSSYQTGPYALRVKTADGSCIGDTGIFYIDGPLTIDRTVDVAGSPGNSPPISEALKNKLKNSGKLNPNLPIINASLKITYPDKGTSWRLKLGNTSLPFPIRVQWEKSKLGKHESRVKIFLKRRARDRYMRKTIVLASNTANSGLFTGEINRNLRTSIYSVTIESLNGKLLAESELFHIVNAENDSK